jgi:Fur family ferric uptake transcriptional regulator
MTSSVEILRAAGLRNTGPRRTVLDVLRETPHATAPQIEAALAGTGPKPDSGGKNLSHQGLYNVLEDLRAAGLVRTIEPAGSPVRYELRVGDNHHHVVCRQCGLVVDVDCHTGTAPCLVPIHDAGFRTIDQAEVTWWGVCEPCATQNDTATTEPVSRPTTN